jgi:hypothetical protein
MTNAQKLSPVYLPTIKLDRKTFEAISRGHFPVRVGQWVEKPDGTRGQFLRTHHGAVYASWAGQGDSFEARTQRFARAHWYTQQVKMDGRMAVTKAPRSMTLPKLRSVFNRQTAV